MTLVITVNFVGVLVTLRFVFQNSLVSYYWANLTDAGITE